MNSISPKKEVIGDKNSLKDYLDLSKQFVDLGLPSGTLWAKYNLGVEYNALYAYDHPEFWYGKYYKCNTLDINKIDICKDFIYGDKYPISVPSREKF